MTQREWMEFLEATGGHKERPLADCDPEGLACIAFCAGWTDADVAIAAAATDLRKEVERLRGWMVYMRKQYARHLPHYKYKDMIAQALNGAEVPE